MSDYSDPGSDYYDSDDGSEIADTHDSDFDDDPIPPTKAKEKSRDPEHKSLSVQQLQDLVDSDIAHVASIVGLESPIASILLRHFNWNTDRLIERFLESADRVLADAGEPTDPPQPSDGADGGARPAKRMRLSPCPPPSEFACPVCCDDAPAAAFALRCKHAFCAACWQAYATAKVKDEGQCTFRCMADGCRAVVDSPAVARLVEPEVNERYHELVRQAYVGAHPGLRFCPHPGCTETVACASGGGSSLATEVPTVRCGAGHVFCFGCGLDSDHRPCVCVFVKAWVRNAREDAGTSQWIKANTRTCPKCENNIEKNGGCNRIMCRHCNFQFCWLCMKNWDVHGYNNAVCNAWKEPDPDEAKTAAKANLDKWLFYFDRFNNHEISARLDEELCARTEEKMVEWQETSKMSWIESTFMRDAVEELTKCRVTLKWSYAMAYFLAAGNKKQIFEDIQADLEKAEQVEADSVKTLRQRMLDKTVYVRGRHEIVLKDTAEGLAKDARRTGRGGGSGLHLSAGTVPVASAASQRFPQTVYVVVRQFVRIAAAGDVMTAEDRTIRFSKLG
ncbi:uncharacterized protein BXZ73DRAFT_93341 [Epithele typhae]|uniref:uncharacterized protein n=1 Tax=Epithele typhae TaxID=378194 RepID=UPI002007C03D|nr:uncharacterized protein BXZ73DRAFT_93341 [Epithele typhae]KAH9911679.1 hypothetical protein BXZ73DRAFT_93341 [Epithele typhae]